MALHAVVYKSVGALSPQLQELVRIADPATGELEFLTPELASRHPEDSLISTSVSLGNAMMISWLAKEINGRWGARCKTLLKTFLYSGSHSGDAVQGDQVSHLSQEIGQIDLAKENLPSDLREFLTSVRRLVVAAKTEKNPIVFV
jgi:hypothetical protein